MEPVQDYSKEPEWPSCMKVNKDLPFNAEPPEAYLRESYHTPSELFYWRNHGPILSLEEDTYSFKISGLVDHEMTFTVDDLKSMFDVKTIEATMICAGNRRTELHEHWKVSGVGWGAAALSTGIWTGVLLKDVLETVGCKYDPRYHVEFEGLDYSDESKSPYISSIPL